MTNEDESIPCLDSFESMILISAQANPRDNLNDPKNKDSLKLPFQPRCSFPLILWVSYAQKTMMENSSKWEHKAGNSDKGFVQIAQKGPNKSVRFVSEMSPFATVLKPTGILSLARVQKISISESYDQSKINNICD